MLLISLPASVNGARQRPLPSMTVGSTWRVGYACRKCRPANPPLSAPEARTSPIASGRSPRSLCRARSPPAARRRGDDGECRSAAIGFALFEIAALDRHPVGDVRKTQDPPFAAPQQRRKARPPPSRRRECRGRALGGSPARSREKAFGRPGKHHDRSAAHRPSAVLARPPRA